MQRSQKKRKPLPEGKDARFALLKTFAARHLRSQALVPPVPTHPARVVFCHGERLHVIPTQHKAVNTSTVLKKRQEDVAFSKKKLSFVFIHEAQCTALASELTRAGTVAASLLQAVHRRPSWTNPSARRSASR